MNEWIEKIQFAFIVIVCICVGIQLIRYICLEIRNHRRSRAPVMTDRAVAYYKHPEENAIYLTNGYNYLYYITFHTDSGLAVKLYMTRDDFYIIQEGSSGMLTWQDDKLWKFIPDNAERSSL